MKANELRIGNWVDAIRYRDDSGNFYPTQVETLTMGWGNLNGKSVYSICINHRYYETGSQWGQTVGNEKEVKPIPLTEEWFQRFGYEHHTEALAHLFDLSANHLGFHLDIHADDWFNMWQKMQVHEFQNWWFSNTGEELTIQQ